MDDYRHFKGAMFEGMQASNEKQITPGSFGSWFGRLLYQDGGDQMKRLSLLPSILTVTTIIAIASALAPATSAVPPRGGTLRVAYGATFGDIPTLDPQGSFSTEAGNFIGMLSDTLVSRNPVTYEFLPGGLATGWDVSSDGLVWTFHLKKDVKFHDGTPFNASHMAASYQRGQKKGLVPKIYLPPDGEILARDAYTFVIKSKQVYGPMLDHLSWPAWFAVTAEYQRQKVGENEYGRQPMGTGPFKFKEWVVGDHITFVRNDDYKWAPAFFKNRGAPYIDEINFKFIKEEATLNAALVADQVDVAYLPNQFAATLRRDGRFNVFTRASGRLIAVQPNNSRPPFTDERVRRAFQRAFDRDKYVQVMTRGEGVPMYGMLVGPLPFYSKEFEQESAKLLAYNPKAALQLLSEAGWGRSSDGLLRKDGAAMKLTMIIRGTDEAIRFGTLTQAMLKDLGITVDLQTLEPAVYNNRVLSGDWDLAISGYGTLTADILTFFWHPTRGYNYAFSKDPQLIALLDRARNSSGESRARNNHEVVRYMRDHAIAIPIINPNQNTIVNKRIVDFIVHKNSMDWLVDDAWIRK